VRRFLYSFGLMLYILLSSAFVQPMDMSENSNISDTSETSKGKKKKKRKRLPRR